jgi:hypothetical protein
MGPTLMHGRITLRNLDLDAYATLSHPSHLAVMIDMSCTYLPRLTYHFYTHSSRYSNSSTRTGHYRLTSLTYRCA